jgi:L-lactate dehydrogenase complex protein LldF
METIAHLDDYLETFTRQARANGIIVHQAVDAQQAVEIVLEIARQSGAKLVAKSKTMVGEEIELNPALEAAGLKVVETDLGEYIVQLRGEPPAHIITPAVHLRRPEVGQTFHEKLGIPYTEDVEDLTTAARRVLRQTFLEADLGISGVNFGVAESGTLCIVTNEGNGRMVTTLPRVHVALMGIERLVPTLNDLALMLALLPRSATGQKITVYTSLIHGPRQAADTDGPDERHVILLDNGRRRMRNSPLAEMLNCIRCGACLNACPVFREIGGHAYIGIGGEHTPYPGPMGSVVSPGLFGQAAFANLARASSLCGACKEACPVDIDLPKLLLRVRAGGIDLGTETNQEVSALSAPQALRRGLRVYSWVARSPQRFALAQRVGGWLGRLAAGGWLRLPAVTGWGLSRDFPRPASKTFHQRWAERERLQTSAAQAEQSASQNQAAPNAPASALPLHELQEQPGRPEQNLVAQSELEERFAAELVALGGTFHLCRREELPARILAVLKEPAGPQREDRADWIAGGHRRDRDNRNALRSGTPADRLSAAGGAPGSAVRQ